MRIFAAMGIALLLAGCAAGGGRLNDRERYDRVMGSPVANPSAIVQAELAFARLAQEEGQWTAFRETATDDAIMFTPDLVNAQQWLKGKADPAQAVTWQPHHIYMSCDGSIAVSTGAWQNAKGDSGRFTTIWQQQDFGQRPPGVVGIGVEADARVRRQGLALRGSQRVRQRGLEKRHEGVRDRLVLHDRRQPAGAQNRPTQILALIGREVEEIGILADDDAIGKECRNERRLAVHHAFRREFE